VARRASRKAVDAVHLPESWTERLPLLEDLGQDWEPVPRAALVGRIIFYVLFLYQVARAPEFCY